MPPSGPRLEIVIVDPLSSSRSALPSRASAGQAQHFGGTFPDVARLGVLDDRHHESGLGLRCDAQMHRAIAGDDAGVVVEVRVDLRIVGDCEHHRAHDERQQGELRLIFAARFVQEGAQLFEFGDIDFFDVREVRNAALRLLHLLRDLAAQSDDRDFFGVVLFD